MVAVRRDLLHSGSFQSIVGKRCATAVEAGPVLTDMTGNVSELKDKTSLVSHHARVKFEDSNTFRGMWDRMNRRVEGSC